MLLVEPREAAGPPCAAPVHLPMSTATKLNFSDYSVKVKSYENAETDTRLNYEQALNAARLGYEQSVNNPSKLQYEQSRLSFDPTADNICADPSYILPAGLLFYFIFIALFPV